LLKPFGIGPHSVRFPDGTNAKGYESKDFTDAWERYPGPNQSENELPDPAEADPSETPETPDEKPSQAQNPNSDRHNGTTQRPVGKSDGFQGVTDAFCDVSKNGTSPYAEKACDVVTGKTPDPGVPRSAAMKLTGHRTEAVYAHYAIVDSSMLQEAAVKLAALHSAESRPATGVRQSYAKADAPAAG
jgi:hypothetical protein